MKKNLIFSGLFLLASLFAAAQTAPYKVVFDLTSGDTSAYKTVIRWLNSISAANPQANMEVVLYGQSLGMVTKNSIVENEVQSLAQKNNIQFAVCEMAMKRHQVDKSELIPGVTTVPDGIYEIIAKQKEGWGYIKAAP